MLADTSTAPNTDAADAEPKPFTPAQLRLVALLAACGFLAFVNFAALAPFLPTIARDLRTSVPLVGQVTTALTLISAALGLVIGPLADLRGHRTLLVAGIIAVALSLAGMALVQTFAFLLPMAIFAGIGDAIVFGLPFAIAGERFQGDQQRRAIAWTSGGISLGIVVAPMLIALVGTVLGWRSALLVTAVATLLLIPLILRWLPADHAAGGALLTLRSVLAAYRPIARSRTMLLLYGASSLRAAGLIGAFAYFGAFIADRFQVDPHVVGIAYLVIGLGVLAGNIVCATFTFRASLLRQFLVAAIVGGLSLGAAMYFTLPFTATLALSTAAAFASSVTLIALSTLLTRATPSGTGTTMVLNGSLTNLGTAVGAATGGFVIAIGGYTLLGILAPLFMLGSVLFVLLVKSARR